MNLVDIKSFTDREELLLQDCEWKIRETEKTCKDRINTAEQAKKEAVKRAEKIENCSHTQLDKVSARFNMHCVILICY